MTRAGGTKKKVFLANIYERIWPKKKIRSPPYAQCPSYAQSPPYAQCHESLPRIPTHRHTRTLFFLSLFVTVPLHSLKYNSQRLNRQYRGLGVVTNVSKELSLVIEGRK